MTSSYSEGFSLIAQPKISTAEKADIARRWLSNNTHLAQKAIDELRRYASEAPLHAALLGPFAERYGIPKPISAFIRLYPEFVIFNAATSPVKSPALGMASLVNDPNYWAKFRRKAIEGKAIVQASVNPWATLGLSKAANPFGDVRVKIFEAFMYGTNGCNMSDLAGACVAFKKLSGVSFQAFFAGLRPAELQKTPFAASRLLWSWTNAEPPCLYAACKKTYFPNNPTVVVEPSVVSELTPIAAKLLPEEIDFSAVAAKHGITEAGAMICYLGALREALSLKVLNNAKQQNFPAIDPSLIKQIYLEAKSAAAEISAVVAKLERLFPDFVK